jgi:hypothetical protein
MRGVQSKLMRSWYSPLPLTKSQEDHLLAAGIEEFCGNPDTIPAHTLILYGPPDEILATASQTLEGPPSIQIIIKTYEALQQLSSSHCVVATWRLQAIQAVDILACLDGTKEIREQVSWPQPDPSLTLLMQGLLKSEPGLLTAYLNLELMAMLVGGEADTQYLQRILGSNLDPQTILNSWWKPFSQINLLQSERQSLCDAASIQATNEQEAWEQVNLTLYQLHQLQEELEQAAQAHRNKDKHIQALQDRLNNEVAKAQGINHRLSQLENINVQTRMEKGVVLTQITKLEQEASTHNDLLRQLREDNQLILSQLYSAQEEAEEALRRASASEKLAEAQHQQLQRVQSLLSRLLGHASALDHPSSSVNVEVLPMIQRTEELTSLQSQALLSTYAHTLHRASALLQRLHR